MLKRMGQNKKILEGVNTRYFFQSKYDYYKKFNTWVIILSALASVTYFVSDCQLFGRMAWETLLPRTFILFPMFVFIFLNRKISDYRVMVVLSYLIIHGIMWCTIWAIYYLPIKQHANEGFIIMHLMFFAVGFCAPFKYGTIAHCLVITNIILSNTFNHYESFDMMLTLGIPCVVAICAVQYVMEQVYTDQFLTRRQLEKALTLDYLTKAYNRNKLKDICDEAGSKLLVAAEKETYILVVDIDFFKCVNDTYGHDGGDKALVYLVETIKSCIRTTDYVIRWGGEEFIVILQNCPGEKARFIAENIRKKVQEGEGAFCPITVSVGVSRYDGKDYHTAITQADEALYTAKKNGRNQVVCFWEEQQTV